MNKSPLQGQEYRSAFTLYSVDGKRAAGVLEFRNGEHISTNRSCSKGLHSRTCIPVGWSVRSLRLKMRVNS